MVCNTNTKHNYRCSTFGHRRNQAEHTHREPSGLAMVDVWWPERGRMHVADGKDRAARMGLRTTFMGHKGPAWIQLCSFIQESPTIYKRWANTQKISRRNGGDGGYSSCHCALRKAAQSLRSAGLPQFCANYVICPEDFYFLSYSGCSRPASCEPERRAVAVLMARFSSHPLSSKIFLHGYIVRLKTPLFEQQRGSLTWLKEKPSTKCTFQAVRRRPLITIAAWQGSAA